MHGACTCAVHCSRQRMVLYSVLFPVETAFAMALLLVELGGAVLFVTPACEQLGAQAQCKGLGLLSTAYPEGQFSPTGLRQNDLVAPRLPHLAVQSCQARMRHIMRAHRTSSTLI